MGVLIPSNTVINKCIDYNNIANITTVLYNIHETVNFVNQVSCAYVAFDTSHIFKWYILRLELYNSTKLIITDVNQLTSIFKVTMRV